MYDPDFPDATLYILMRTDMQSLNAGKGMAQAAHAANQFVHNFGNTMTPGYDDWKMGGGDSGARCVDVVRVSGFGTTIILAIFGEPVLRHYLDNAVKLGHPAEIILDPTYPVSDGEVTHLIPVHTCGYVFMKDRHENGGALIEGLELHP